MLDSEDHFLPEPQGDVTKGADKRKVQLVRVKSTSSVCSASEHLNTLVKMRFLVIQSTLWTN